MKMVLRFNTVFAVMLIWAPLAAALYAQTDDPGVTRVTKPPIPRSDARPGKAPAGKKRLTPVNPEPARPSEGLPARRAPSRDMGGRSAADYLRSARLHYGKFELDEAIADLNRALAKEPNMAEALYIRGTCHRSKGDAKAAMADYTRVLEIDPERADAARNRAGLYVEALDMEAAIADYTVALSQWPPETASIFVDRGSAKRFLGNNDQAIADYNAAIEREPGNFRAYLFRGQTYLEKKDYAAAAASCGKATEIVRANSEALKCRADADGALRNYSIVVASLSDAIGKDPQNAKAYFERGNFQLQNFRFDDAIADYDRALQIDPKFAFAFLNRGTAYLAKKEYERAMSDIDAALAINPSLADGRLKKGTIYFARKDHSNAVEEFSLAIGLARHLADAYYQRSLALIEMNDLRRAIDDLTTYLSYDKDNVRAYLRRAAVYDRLGEKVLADRDRATAKVKAKGF